MENLNGISRHFGISLQLLTRYFSHTLNVIPQATYVDEINTFLKEPFSLSLLSRIVNTLFLSINICVQLQNDLFAQSFSHQLLNISIVKIILHKSRQCIKLQDIFCKMVAMKDALIESIFPDFRTNYIKHAWLHERVILEKITILVFLIFEYNSR